ncbi:hypothetical protein B0A50_07348 [Salinomyces thailandicus]|uniref:BRCT domain-containing protein n=1 Tax=Salinomyces thailandicus TaxID=706561 RepID=A0A4U0TMT0_9PEZI|nr:hypothetical protein B0A50_07348 [Salinomyces thailandica]
MADVNNTLRKKPVRRAAGAKKSAPEAKPKNTRSKKTANETEESTAEESHAEEVSEGAQAKARRGIGRPRKTATAPTAEETASAKPVKATRATAASRAKRTEVMVDVEADAPAPVEPKPARRTRAAASKAPPLSPKKITQVSRPTTRNTKGNKKQPTAAKPATRTRATRNRAVSDENANVPDLAPPQTEDDDLVVVSATPVKRPMSSKQSVKSDVEVASEGSMSSRPTTPSDSPVQNFERLNDENEYRKRGVQTSVSDASSEDEEAHQESNQNSDDELCGPKTPMKRASPGAEARYRASVQKTVRRVEHGTPMESPRTFANRMVNRGTPQTQKPYNKPPVPASGVKSMTVSRGTDRAFVFNDLRAKFDKTEELNEAIEEEEDQSSLFMQDDSVCPTNDAEFDAQSLGCEDEGSIAGNDDALLELDEHRDDNTEIDAGSVADADETIVDENVPQSHTSQELELELSESENTVLITQGEDDSLPEAEDTELEISSPVSTTPETLIWENLREDVTIPVNFDEHLSGARVLPQPEATERLSIAADLASFAQHGSDDETIAGADQDLSDEGCEQIVDVPEQPAVDLAAGRPSLGATINLNDFIDFAALAEPTEHVELPTVDFGIDQDNGEANVAQEPEASVEDSLLFENMVDHVTSTEAEQVEESLLLDNAIDQITVAAKDQAEKRVLEPTDEVLFEDETMLDDVPHYALPTISYDARRKSLPAFSFQTPVKAGFRPKTSDGASMPRVVIPFSQRWWSRSGADSAAVTPRPSRSRATAQDVVKTPEALRAAMQTPGEHAKTAVLPTRFRTPVPSPRRRPATAQKPAPEAPTPRASTLRPRPAPRASVALNELRSPSKAVSTTPITTSNERFPRFEPRKDYSEHASTVAAPARFHNPNGANTPKQAASARKPAIDAATPRLSSLRPRAEASAQQTTPSVIESSPSVAATPTPAATSTPRGERFPRLPPQEAYQTHANTVAAPARFRTPAAKPATRQAATAQKAAAPVAQAPRTSTPRSRRGRSQEEDQGTPSAGSSSPSIAATPTPAVQTPVVAGERFPALPAQQTYEHHAHTVAAPARFRTPAKSPLKNAPSTTQKSTSLHKRAVQNHTTTRTSSHTPIKTPLKPAAAATTSTPAYEALTPHPSAPLRSVTALVEVFTLEGASASAPFIALLHRLGAKTTRVWSERVTHVIFKDGSPTTLQRVRVHNKAVTVATEQHGQEKGMMIKKKMIHCVNSRWISDCEAKGRRVDETDEAYAVDVAEVPRGGKRRRKSMEPAALVNLGGNLVRDRKSSFGRASIGRSSLGRSPMKFDVSPEKEVDVDVQEELQGAASASSALELTLEVSDRDKENLGEEEEPATPAYLAAPETLVQRTAPIKRMAKLNLKSAGEESKGGRRLSYFPTRV